VGLDEVGLLVGLGLLLGLAELLDQTHGLALETTVEPSAGTGVDKVAKLLRAEVEELVEVDSTVGELAERALGLEGCGVLSAQILLHHYCVCVCLDNVSPSIICSLHPLLSRAQRYRGGKGRGSVKGSEIVPAASSAFYVAVSRRMDYCSASNTHVFGISHGCGGREARKLTRWGRRSFT
jgi:hypothetical protein